MPIPPDTRSAGDSGHIIDHNNIADELTTLTAAVSAAQSAAEAASDPAGSAASAQSNAEAASLPRAGGTMSGPIAMGGSKVTGAGNAAASGDLVPLGQLGSAAFEPSSAFDAAGAAVPQSDLSVAPGPGSLSDLVVVSNPAVNSVAADINVASILNSGQTGGFNCVIGGDGFLTCGTPVGSKQANATLLGTGASYSTLLNYDTVAGGIDSNIAADHSWTSVLTTHSAIYGGSFHRILGAATVHTCQPTHNSATVADTAVTAAMVGWRVIAGDITGSFPPGTVISSVTPGVSFVASSPWRGATYAAPAMWPVTFQRVDQITVANGSAAVTDPSITSADAGAGVFLPGFPYLTTVTSPVAGFGFTASNAYTGTAGTFGAVIGGLGQYHSIGGGTGNTVTGTAGSFAAGQYNTVGAATAFAVGSGNYAGGVSSAVMGQGQNVTGIAATAAGRDHVASGNYTTALGRAASAVNEGTLAHADGQFATTGDGQYMRLILGCQTANATPTNCGMANNTALVPQMPLNTTWSVRAWVTAHGTGSQEGTSDWWEIRGCWQRGASGIAAAVGSQLVLHGDGSALPAPSVQQSGSAGLQVQVTGIASQAFNWKCVFEVTQVSG